MMCGPGCWEEQQLRYVALGAGCSERKRNNSYDVWLWGRAGRNSSYDMWHWVLGVLKERGTIILLRCVALSNGCSERKRNNSYDVWLWGLGGTAATICGTGCCMGVLKERGTIILLRCVALSDGCSERKRNNSYDVRL